LCERFHRWELPTSFERQEPLLGLLGLRVPWPRCLRDQSRREACGLRDRPLAFSQPRRAPLPDRRGRGRGFGWLRRDKARREPPGGEALCADLAPEKRPRVRCQSNNVAASTRNDRCRKSDLDGSRDRQSGP
jgi:hypothetical protein